MSAAQLDLQPLDESGGETEAASFALREQVVERLAAHRARRGHPSAPQTAAAPKPVNAGSRSARIAATVAERYAQSQSYRAFLAAEAERAIHQAEAAAEVAALSAKAVAEAQNQLLFELDQISTNEPTSGPTAVPSPAPAYAIEQAADAQPSSTASSVSTAASTSANGGGLTVRLYQDADLSHVDHIVSAQSLRVYEDYTDEAEGLALDEEIAFRQSPVFEEPAGPNVDIPANLIEFPRQLVAPRRARPRLAEGPLREDADPTAQSAQLRIFEVEATQISSAPVVESVEPEWSTIRLTAHPAAPATGPEPRLDAQFSPSLVPQTAALNLRLMAGVVDGCIVLAAFLAFVAAFAFTCGKLSGGHVQINLQIAAIGSVSVLAILGLFYQVLFFTFAEATPGMRYARIGLCTFSDENPTRSAMRRRIFAAVLAACPIGIGFLWAWLDDDGLGWHDRISRMYQRSY
jgi:uncharacterized RDD family membrane protein YckC